MDFFDWRAGYITGSPLQGYKEIYCKNDLEFWQQLSYDIDNYSSQKNIIYTNYFNHSLLVSKKQGK